MLLVKISTTLVSFKSLVLKSLSSQSKISTSRGLNFFTSLAIQCRLLFLVAVLEAGMFPPPNHGKMN